MNLGIESACMWLAVVLSQQLHSQPSDNQCSLTETLAHSHAAQTLSPKNRDECWTTHLSNNQSPKKSNWLHSAAFAVWAKSAKTIPSEEAGRFCAAQAASNMQVRCLQFLFSEMLAMSHFTWEFLLSSSSELHQKRKPQHHLSNQIARSDLEVFTCCFCRRCQQHTHENKFSETHDVSQPDM